MNTKPTLPKIHKGILYSERKINATKKIGRKLNLTRQVTKQVSFREK
jgi:hypothetical protein